MADVFSGEKWVEHAVANVLRNAAAGIVNLDDYGLASLVLGERKIDPSDVLAKRIGMIEDGVMGIGEQVDDHLLELIGVAQDRRASFGQVDIERNVGQLQSEIHEMNGGTDAKPAEPAAPAATESIESPQQVGGTKIVTPLTDPSVDPKSRLEELLAAEAAKEVLKPGEETPPTSETSQTPAS